MTATVEATRRGPFAAAVAVGVLLVAAAYANHFDNDFQFDDAHVIEDNLAIRSLANVPRFFTDATTFSAVAEHQTYRPLLSATYAVDFRLGGGLEPRAFHVSQFLFHLLVGLGVFLLVRGAADLTAPGPANRWVALVAAVWFCIHTGNTETVNYLSARSDILSTLGVVASFAVYHHLPRSRRLHLYLLPMLLGALAKPPALVFAPLLFLWVLFFEEDASLDDVVSPHGGPKVWPALLKALPAFALAVAAFFFIEGMNAEGQSYGGAATLDYLRTQAWVWLHYARLFVLPAGLTADTDWGLIPSWTDTRVVVGVAALALVAWITVVASRRRAWRPVAFGLGWFLLGLLPTSSIFPLAEVTNEHRIYLPFVGLVLVTAWAGTLVARSTLARSGRLGAPWGVAVAVVLLAHLLGTISRNRVWRTEQALWTDVVAKSPANGRAWMNLGLTSLEEGRYEEARDLFQEARERWPTYSPVYVNLGITTFRLGDTVSADAFFRRAVDLAPERISTRFFHARFLLESGQGPAALEKLQETVARAPSYMPGRELLLKLYYVIGSASEVEALALGTLSTAPDDQTALAYLAGRPPVGGAAPNAFERGVELTAQDRHLEAGVAYRRYLDEVGPDADAFLNLGWSQAKLGFDALAAISFRQVLALRPDDALARNNLAWVEGRMGGSGIVPGS